jgi:hypothetical protein
MRFGVQFGVPRLDAALESTFAKERLKKQRLRGFEVSAIIVRLIAKGIPKLRQAAALQTLRDSKVAMLPE